jgi:hypothetical protein
VADLFIVIGKGGEKLPAQKGLVAKTLLEKEKKPKKTTPAVVLVFNICYEKNLTGNEPN